MFVFNIINGKITEKDILNDNQCSILIGSKMIERRITLDNFLVTFLQIELKIKVQLILYYKELGDMVIEQKF